MTHTLLIAFAAMLWGSDLLLRPPLLQAGWSAARVVLWEHLLLTALFAVPLWRGRRALMSLSRGQWGALVFIAWGGSALATWLYTTSFTLGQPLFPILLQKTQPVFALVLAGWLLREKRAAGFWAWCALALIGAYALTGIRTLPHWADAHWQQAAFALGAAVLWGASTVAGRTLTFAVAPATLAGARFALALPPLLAAALWHGGAHVLGGARQGHAWLFLALVVLLPDLLGMTCYYQGLRKTTASVATLAELCYPLTALVIGLTVQHASLAPSQWLGLVLLVGSVLRLGAQPQVASLSNKPVAALAPLA